MNGLLHKAFTEVVLFSFQYNQQKYKMNQELSTTHEETPAKRAKEPDLGVKIVTASQLESEAQ